MDSNLLVIRKGDEDLKLKFVPWLSWLLHHIVAKGEMRAIEAG
jgi:hypothetical protein